MIQNVIDTTSEFWPIPYFLPYLNAVDQVSRQIGVLRLIFGIRVYSCGSKSLALPGCKGPV